MPITIRGTQFHLRTKNTSYVMSVFKNRYLIHLYWGEPISEKVDLTHLPEEKVSLRASAFHVPVDEREIQYLSDLKMEYSTVGGGFWGVPSCHCKYADGSTVSEFEYEGYEITKGKPDIEGLPHIYTEKNSEAETLLITFSDRKTGLKMVMSYSLLYDYDVITRSVRYINCGGDMIHMLSAQSACVDFSGNSYKLLHLHGDWLRERSVEFADVSHGIYTIDSKRGMSSHMNNPFAAVMDKNADEYNGNVYGFSLVYSGNFAISCEGGSCGSTRVTIGINPFDFDWELESGEAFQTPEAVLVYSPCGINEMSRKFHRVFRERLVRGKYRDKLRPIVANTWEAVEMNFDEEKLVAIAEKAAALECELLLLDDGWYRERNSTKCSLGDWNCNLDKLPNGLDGLCKRINKVGMDLGIWLEPEMVSPDSNLYRAHPDWCIYSEGRRRTEMRDELILDLSRKEVRDYVFDRVSAVLNSADIKYVKWDCNRNITEPQNQMQSHKYVLGLYDLLERLNNAFPDVLFESCSGGGGRFDPGMLYYMPQTWTSDNTRIRGRYEIQYGTSIVYPASSICAHIAKINPHAEQWDKQINTTALLAMGGQLGFELDLSIISKSVEEQCLSYVRLYKQIRETVIFGDMYRLENPFEGERLSWEYTDENTVLLFCFQKKNAANGEERRIKLKGLNADALYECNGRKFYGDELMKSGVVVSPDVYDYHAELMIFKLVKE